MKSAISLKDFSKKSHLIPNFMLNDNFEHHSKPFGLYHLEKSWMNINSSFKNLIKQIADFNKQLIFQKNTVEIKDFLKTYHLYKNLCQRLSDLNLFIPSIKQAKPKIQEISKWFYEEKLKTRSLSKKLSVFPGIKKQIQDRDEQQNLYRTLSQIRTKRQWQIHQIMPKTAYSEHFLPKDRTLEYRKQEQFSNLSDSVSEFSQYTPRKNTSLYQANSHILHSKSSKNLTGITSTAFSSQVKVNQRSSFFEKTRRFSVSSQKQKIKRYSEVFNDKKRKGYQKFSRSQSSKSLFTPMIKTKNTNSYKFMQQMIRKTKIDKIVDQLEPHIINSLGKKQCHTARQIDNINCSRISFILNPTKTQAINRKDFFESNKLMIKFKKNHSRQKTDLNKKLQFRKYMSNHIKAKGMQVHKDQKLASLTQRIGSNLLSTVKKQIELNSKGSLKLNPEQFKGHNLKAIPEQNILDPIQKKRKDFQESIRKNHLKQSLSVYSKYLNSHLQQPNNEGSVENRSEFNETSSSRFSKISSSRFGTTKKSLLSQSNKNIQSLTSFTARSLQKKIQPKKNLAVCQILEKQSVLKNNHAAVDQVLKIKLRMNTLTTKQNEKKNIIAKALYKGLELHQGPKECQYVMIQPKLLSNPFFVVPKRKLGKKKKK